MQEKYDTLKNELTYSPNLHHQSELNKLSETIQDEITSIKNRHKAFHGVGLDNTGSQTPNPKKNSNSNHIPGH